MVGMARFAGSCSLQDEENSMTETLAVRGWIVRTLVVLGLLGLAALPGFGQRMVRSEARAPIVVRPVGEPVETTATAAPESTEAALQEMAGRAGVIFAGEVMAVRHPQGFAGSPQDAAEGMVEVEFQVDVAVEGIAEGSRFVLREWAGLWAGGVERYRVGQRLLMFLHAPDAHGVTSPVDGMDGAMPLMGNGVAPAAGDSMTTPGGWLVDLRWVQTHVRRAAVAANEVTDAVEAADKAVETQHGVSIFSEPVVMPGVPAVWHPVSAMPKETTASLESVMSMCQRWRQKQDVASR